MAHTGRCQGIGRFQASDERRATIGYSYTTRPRGYYGLIAKLFDCDEAGVVLCGGRINNIGFQMS